jgi:hypothetical protein
MQHIYNIGVWDPRTPPLASVGTKDVAGPLFGLPLFISMLFMDHVLLLYKESVYIQFVSSTARFSNLLLFSRVPAVNNYLHVANPRFIKRRDQMFRSLFRIREISVSNIGWKILTDFSLIS